MRCVRMDENRSISVAFAHFFMDWFTGGGAGKGIPVVERDIPLLGTALEVVADASA